MESASIDAAAQVIAAAAASGSAPSPRQTASLSRAWDTLLSALVGDEPLRRCLALRALDGSLESLHGALAGRGGVRRRIAAALAEMVAADEIEHNRREAAVLLGKMAAMLAAEGGASGGGAATSATAGSAGVPLASVSSGSEGAWTAALAYPALKSFLAQSLPAAHARLLGETPSPFAPSGHAPKGSQGGGTHGAPQKAASLGGKVSATASAKAGRDASSSAAGPTVSATATPAAAAPAFSAPAENSPAAQTATLVAALEAFGYLLDSAPACTPQEAQRVDDLLAALLGAVESSSAAAAAVPSGGTLCADVFVRAQALCVLAQQLRFTHRNRRRIARLIPALKRLMASAGGSATSAAASAAAISTAASPATSAPSSSPTLIAGATSHNVPVGSESLHPALLRSLGRVVSTWYVLPPDRILRRFPAPAMLRGYAAREWAKLHVGSGNDGRRGESGGGQQHRRNVSSSTSLLSLLHQRPLSSSPAADARTGSHRPSHRPGASISGVSDVLDSSVYSLQDSDELGWASARGVDALLADMAKWASRKSVAEVDARATTPAHALAVGRPSSNKKGAASASKAPPPQQQGNRPALSLSGGGDGDDLVNELLSQWQDVTFGLRGDMTIGPPPPVKPAASSGAASTALQPSKATSSKGKSRTSAQLKPRAGGAKGTTKTSTALQSRSSTGATATSAFAAVRCYTVEFSTQTCVRVLQLHNRSAQHAHDFFLQVHPGWLWRAEPAWGTLEPRSSRAIKLIYTPSPLDVAGTRSGGFVRVRSAQGFALERLELVGFSGPTLRVLNAAGNAGTPLHLAAAASQRNSTATSRPGASVSQSLSLVSKGGSSSGGTSNAAFEASDSCEPTIDFGVCVVGVARSVDIYVQNIGPFSAQATIAYLPGTQPGPGSAATGAAAKSKGGSSVPSQPLPAFSVIPSLLFLRPHQTARVRVMFYPAVAGPSPPSARLAVMGPGEECYSFALRGRGGAPLGVSPGQGLDFGPVDLWRGTGGGAREIVAELMGRGVEPAELGEALAPLAAAVTAAATAAAAASAAHHHRRMSSLSAAFSSAPSFTSAPAAPRPGVHVQWLSLTNHNEAASLAVSFRYSGQRDESEGRERHRAVAAPSSSEDDDGANDIAAVGPSDLSQFCPLYVRDTVIPAGGTARVAVVFLAQAEGAFSRRLFINTPATPTDSLSVLVSAHVGPFLRVGRSGVVNLPPVSANTAAHHVLPLRNLASCNVDVEVRGLDRTPLYWVLARVPMSQPQLKALEQSRNRVDKKKINSTAAAGKAGSSFAALISSSSNAAAATAGAASHPDELNEQFDPADSLSALGGSFGRDFLPQPLPLADCSTGVLSSLALTPQRVALRPLETVLLHLWFVSPVPGFYSVPFSVRGMVGAAPGRAPVIQEHGPVEIKAVCLARSGLEAVAPRSDVQGHMEGAAAAAAAAAAALEAEDPDSAALLRSSTAALLSGAVQYRADASSLSLHPLRKFSSLPSNRALYASPAGGAQGGGPSRSYLSEFVAVPSERFDAEMRAFALPPSEGGAQSLLSESIAAAESEESAQLTGKRRASLMAGVAASGPDYLLCRLPNGVQFGSTLLRLPPRLWLWRRKTMMVLLNNQTTESQPFFAFLSFPFRSALVDQLDSWAELDSAGSSLAEGGRGPSLSSLRARSAAARSDAPNRVAPGQTVKIDLSLPSLEEYAGARAKELVRAEARERERNDAAAANNNSNNSGYPGLYGDARNRRGSLRGNSGDLMAAVDESGGDPDAFASDTSSPRSFKTHSLATGYLALVDAQNHLCVCALRGVLGDLVSVETDPRALVFECTVAQSGSVATADGDSGDADAPSSSQASASGRPVTLYLKVVNHTDLSIALGFRLTGAAAVSASGSIRSATNGFSVGALLPPWLSAYETRLVPVTFAPGQIGRYSADLACWYANPYSSSERFDCFSVRLQGQFVHPGLVEFEQSGGAADDGTSGGAMLATGFAALPPGVESSSSSSGVFVDCGTVLAPSSDIAASPSVGVATSVTAGKGALLTLHNSSNRQLLVSALGCAPFIVSLPDDAREAAAKDATASHNNDRALIAAQTTRPVDPPADAVGSLLGDNASARRRNAWAERRAARMRLKSGTSYVLDDGGRGDSVEATSSLPQQSGTRGALQPVSQQLAPLSSISFRIDFVPASWARGAFAARILLCFSRYWRSVDVFGVAGQLQLSSNFGQPTSTRDIAPGSSVDNNSASAPVEAPVAVPNDSAHARTRFGIGYGGGVQKQAGSRPRHHREASMPIFSSPASLEQIDLFNPAVAMHARRSSLNMGMGGSAAGVFAKSAAASAASTGTAGAAAAGPTPIDLGLSPLKRLMSRAFHLTNTGSTAMLILRIHVSNAQGGVAGGAFEVGSGSGAPLSARQGGMGWSFAHTTTVRDAAGSRSASGQVKEVRLHTVASGAGNGPALNVHARNVLSATALKANALANAQRKRTGKPARQRAAAIATAEIASPDPATVAAVSVARNRADGFGAPGLDLDLDALCVDWDEVDYQLDAAAAAPRGEAQGAGTPGAGRGHKGSSSLLAGVPYKARRGGRRTEQGNSDAHSASDGDDAPADASGSDEEGNSSRDDFPLLLHPGHSLPLTLSWFKEQPGAYLHEVQISCSDPASAAAKTGGAIVQSSSHKVIASSNDKLTQSRAGGSKPVSETAPSSGSDLAAVVSKRFDFLFRVAAQEVLRIDPGRSLLDFGIVRLGQAHHAAASATKPLTFSFLNEGPLPLNWRLLKLSVQLSRMRGGAVAVSSIAAGRNVSASRRKLLRDLEEGQDGAGSDTDGASSDGDVDTLGVDFVKESAVHETAFALSPSSGTLQPRQRQTVSVHFVPRVPHLRYAWSVRLHTVDMIRAADQAAEGGGSTSRRGSKSRSDSTLLRLIGVAGSSMLQLIGVDDATGLQRPLPFALPSAFPTAGTAPLASAQELSFGCISVGCERRKRLLLHNPGELPTPFELSSPPSVLQRFTLDPPTGFVAPGGTVELRALFTPNAARSFSSTMLVRWGSALQSQNAAGSVGSSADVELSEMPLRLLLTGRGGSSALHVPEPTLDFGTVTVNQDHVRLLRVQNVAGGAEGQVLVSIDHPNLRLKQPDAVTFVQPGGVCDVPVIFHPTSLAPLSATIFVRTPDGSSSAAPSSPLVAEVSVRGLVGVPRIVVRPEGALDHLDFGTCLTGSSRALHFCVSNAGNVDVKFEAVFVRVKAGAVSAPSKRQTRSSASAARGGLVGDTGLEQVPSLSRVRHGGADADGGRRSALELIAPFVSLSGASTALADQQAQLVVSDGAVSLNDNFFEDHEGQLEEFTPRSLSVYPNQGRIRASVAPAGSTIPASSAAESSVNFTLTFSPSDRLELLNCALLIRSTHNAPAATEEQARANRDVSSFDSLYAPIRGLAGEQRLLLETVARHIDFGLCRVGGTVSRVVHLSNPGNVRVDFHVGPDLDSDPVWAAVVAAAEKQRAAAMTAQQGASSARHSLHSPVSLSQLSSAVAVPALDYSSLRKVWLESFNALGFDLVHSGSVLPGVTASVVLLYTPRSEAAVRACVRVVSNAGVGETLEIEGEGAQSRLHLLRGRTLGLNARPAGVAAAVQVSAGRGFAVPDPKLEVEAIDFGLLPITTGGGGSGASSAAMANGSSPYRKLFWLYNSGKLPAPFLLSLSALPHEFEIRPLSGTVPPGQFAPLAVSFNPRRINTPVSFVMKFLGGEKDAAATAGGSNSAAASPISPTGVVVPAGATVSSDASAAFQPQLSIPVSGCGGLGILGVCFLSALDSRWSGVDFGIVSVHGRHGVEKYFTLYNCGSVPLRIKVAVDNADYTLGVAGALSTLTGMQIAAAAAGPSATVDETAVQNEIRYNARLNNYHTTNTHFLLGARGRGKKASRSGGRAGSGGNGVAKLGQSAFDYVEKPDGSLEHAPRASVLTYLLAASSVGGDTEPATGSKSQRGSHRSAADAAARLTSPALDALSTGLLGSGMPSLPLGTELDDADLLDVSTDKSALSPRAVSARGSSPSSAAPSNPYTARVAGAHSLECLLPPGHYLPIFVRLFVALEKSYMATVTVSSAHKFLSVPVRAEGGVVALSHSGSLDFGTIGCFHRYTKMIVLRNTGTVPTRAKLFWRIRGSGQEEGGGSHLALSGAAPLKNPFIDSSDEDESSDDEELSAAHAIDVEDVDAAVGEDAEAADAVRAARAAQLARQVAARQNRRAAREARKRARASASSGAAPLVAADTYKSVLRLYARDDAPPPQLNVTRLWWQHCIKFVRILLRSYKMMYPSRSSKLFAQQGLGAAGAGARAMAGPRLRALSPPSSPPHAQARASGGPGAKPAQPPANGDPAAVSGNRASGAASKAGAAGLEDYLGEVERKKAEAEESRQQQLREAEEETRLASQAARIKRALIVISEMDPGLNEHGGMGGSRSALDCSAIAIDAPPLPLQQSQQPASTQAVAAGNGADARAAAAPVVADTVDPEVGLAPSHPMFASARLLSTKGRAVESTMRTLVARVQHRYSEAENPALAELLAAAARLNLRMDRKKLPRIGDPGDGAVDMREADSADRVPQLRLSPGTVLLAKDSRVEIQVDLNVPHAGAFNASLIVECELAGVDRYEIPLRASAAQVDALFDDHSCLDFGRLPLGDTELRTRTLTNMGTIPLKFRVQNDNSALSVEPMEGTLMPGRRRAFAFTFRPTDEAAQTAPVRLLTNCTPPLLLSVFGAGGVPRLHMDSFERLDFGRCMIGKAQTRLLRLTNTGNANLPILMASLDESAVFSKGLRANAQRDANQLLQPGAVSAEGAADKARIRRGKKARFTGSTIGGAGAGGSVVSNAGEDIHVLTNSRRDRSLLAPAATAMAGRRNGGQGVLSSRRAAGGGTNDSDSDAPVGEEPAVSGGDDDSDLDAMLSDAVGAAASAHVPIDLAALPGPTHDWPSGRVVILPGDTLTLAIEFRPSGESLYSGRVSLETANQCFHLELAGTGREALLVYDQKMIDFHDCLVGNTYTKVFSLMNVGEIVYPVSLTLQDQSSSTAGLPATVSLPLLGHKPGGTGGGALASPAAAAAAAPTTDGHPSSDDEQSTAVVVGLPSAIARRPVSGFELKVHPSSLVLGAFEKKVITVTFTPTRDLRCSARLILDSVYSHNEIPVHMLAGTASLDLSSSRIDFGLVEQGTRVASVLTLRNTGSLPLAFRIKPPSLKPFQSLPFTLSKWSGVIPPSASVDVMCRAHLVELGSFDEEMCVETERVGQRYFFSVTAKCARSVVDASHFSSLHFGACPVGTPVSQVVAIHNSGGFPLSFDMHASFPLSVLPQTGSVAGGQTQTFQVSWLPAGGYELKSSVHVHTNIGVFDINVRGTGAYPRFVLRDAQIDFGVGAFHHTYERRFFIVNRGRVPIAWSVPSIDAGYALHPESGVLAAGEEGAVAVRFTPTRVGLYQSSFIVESAGRYREVNLVGMGGVLSLDYPEHVELEACAAGHWSRTSLTLRNTGDVTLRARFRLDRNSIHAEANTDDEADEAEDEQTKKTSSVEGEVNMAGECERATREAQTDLLLRSSDHNDAEAETALIPPSASRVGRLAVASSPPTRPSSIPFAVKILPPALTVAPKSSASVIVRTWVPPTAEGPFTFRLRLVLPEATLPVHFSGVGTVIRLSNYARALCVNDAQTVLATLLVPPALAPPPVSRSRALSATADSPGALPPIFLSSSSLAHASLPFNVSEGQYRRQQIRWIERLSRRFMGAHTDQHDDEPQRSASTSSAASAGASPGVVHLARCSSSLSTVALDSDVIVVSQVLDSMVAALSLVIEHRALLEQSAAAAPPLPSSGSSSSSSSSASSIVRTAANADEFVARHVSSELSASVLCLPHAPHSVACAHEAFAADSGTGRGGHTSGEILEKHLTTTAVSAPAVSHAEELAVATPLLPAQCPADDRDGVLLGVFGVTHLADRSPSLRSSAADSVAALVLECEPRLPTPSHANLLRHVEPTHNAHYLAILPNLLAEPPEFIDEFA